MNRLLALLLLASVMAGCGKPEQDKAVVAAGVRQRREYLEAHLPDEIRKTIPEDFYTHKGVGDWWRMPLVFPYQLDCIDTREMGHVTKYDPAQAFAKGSSASLLYDVHRLSTDNRFLLFDAKGNGKQAYMMFEYATGVQTAYESEDELYEAAHKAGFKGRSSLMTVDDMMAAYYDYKTDFLGAAAQGDDPDPAP